MTTLTKDVAFAMPTDLRTIAGGNIITMDSVVSLANKFTINSFGQLVVGSGISTVFVSASWSVYPDDTGFRRVNIRHNNNAVAVAFTDNNATGYTSASICGVMFNVTTGDVIDLYNQETKMSFWPGTYLTVFAF